MRLVVEGISDNFHRKVTRWAGQHGWECQHDRRRLATLEIPEADYDQAVQAVRVWPDLYVAHVAPADPTGIPEVVLGTQYQDEQEARDNPTGVDALLGTTSRRRP
jgi:hypothetical protein